MADPVIIEEIVRSGALRVELRDADLPYARPRDTAGFESGGTVEHKKVYLPGRGTPIYQVQQARERDLVIKGAFRDHLFVREGGAEGTAHARHMRDQIEQIRRRANPVRVTWGDERRTGLLAEARFGEESASQITYEMTFAIARLETADRARPQQEQRQQRAPSDVVGQIRRSVAQRRAEMEALQATQTARSVVIAIDNGLALADTALAAVEGAATVLETADAGAVAGMALRLIGAAQAVAVAVRTVQTTARLAGTSEAVPTRHPGSLSAWWRAQFATVDELEAIADQIRELQVDARERMGGSGVRLYRVRPGDTLESIAVGTMGDAARAGDLGVRAEDLVPGMLIRIPEAT